MYVCVCETEKGGRRRGKGVRREGEGSLRMYVADGVKRGIEGVGTIQKRRAKEVERRLSAN